MGDYPQPFLLLNYLKLIFMKKRYTKTCPTRNTDWALSHESRILNKTLGVNDCDSVSQTTTDGLHSLTNNNLSNKTGLDVVHAGMVGVVALPLLFGAKGAKVSFLGAIGLSVLYALGRSQDK